MIAPYNSASAVSAGIDGAFKPEWTSACLVTNATKVQKGGWLEWLRISGACLSHARFQETFFTDA